MSKSARAEIIQATSTCGSDIMKLTSNEQLQSKRMQSLAL